MLPDGEVAIKVSNVSKAFKLPHEKRSSIKGLFVNMFHGKRTYERQQVLKDVSLEVRKGDFFGIVGRNGSGKSTLLKMLAGIYAPDEGHIEINGKLTPFIELGVGFNDELTGRENVFLNGALLGFSREEMSAMYDEIVQFAELERFMDQKLKNYSSGMQVRLAFSIAIRAESDILVLDEVLAVGDEAFQRKCDNFFANIKKDSSKTIILVTHSMESVKKYCTKAILIKEGSIIASGDPSDVANLYIEENLNTNKKTKTNGQYEPGLSRVVPLLRASSEGQQVVSSPNPFYFKVEYEYKGEDKQPLLAYSIEDVGRGGIVYDSGPIRISAGKGQRTFSVPTDLFNSTNFRIIATIREGIKSDSKKTKMVGFTSDTNSLFFSIRNNNEKSNYALLNRDVYKVEMHE